VLDADHGQPGLGEPSADLLAADSETDDHHVRLLRLSHARQLSTEPG
jgi:hypothetical protein